MKKSVLTLAVVAALFTAHSAAAATVYDKDGTSMDIGGRVQGVFYNGAAAGLDNNDATISDNVRMNVSGRTELYEGISAFGFWEHQWQHDGYSDEALYTRRSRSVYVGVDFDKFGLIQVGRFPAATYYVTEVTDVFEDFGCAGALLDDQRNSGKIRYAFSGYGVDFYADYQTAINRYAIPGYISDAVDINGGFALSLGYTTPEVLLGPVSIRLGYEYLKAQGEDLPSNTPLKHVNSWAASLSWGGEEGLFFAAQYNMRDFKFHTDATDDDGERIPDYKAKGFEVVAGYNFTCGVTVVAGYEYLRYEFDSLEQGERSAVYVDYTSRKVPVYVNYAVNPNFNIWTEAQFDANSSDVRDFDNERIVPDKALFSVGARYSF